MMRELVHTLKELLLVDLSTVPGSCWYAQKSYQTNINDVFHAMLFFFFWQFFYILVTKYVEVQIDIKDFLFWEKMIPSQQIMMNCFLKLPYLDNTFQLVAKIQ
jgi:hypothetical protein